MSITKKVVLILFLGSPAWSAVTSQQIEQARQATSQIMDTADKLQAFILQVKPLIAAGNAYQTDFSTNTVSLTAAQVQDIVAKYQSFKTDLQNEFNGLP